MDAFILVFNRFKKITYPKMNALAYNSKTIGSLIRTNLRSNFSFFQETINL